MQDVREAFHMHTFFYSAKKKIIKSWRILREIQKTVVAMLLDSIGGSLKGRNDYGCCDVCLFFDERFDIFQVQSNVNVEEQFERLKMI